MSTVKDEAIKLRKNIDTVYEAGQKAEYDRFWDEYQQNGTRTSYALAFAGTGWNTETFKPKYPLTVSYGFEMFRQCGELDASIIDIDFTNNTSFSNFARQGMVIRFGVMNFTGCNSAQSYTFYDCAFLETIEKMIFKNDGTTNFTSSSNFQGCYQLKNITVEGVIGLSIDFTWSPLTVESMKSVINALKNYSETDKEHSYSVKFKDDCWAALEADSTAPNGDTWKNYVFSLGWNT